MSKFLLAGEHARSAPVAGAVDLPHAGQCRLWVRSKDFPKDRPGIRTFTVRLGQQPAGVLFGKHGQAEFDGWGWEDGGTFELPAERISSPSGVGRRIPRGAMRWC